MLAALCISGIASAQIHGAGHASGTSQGGSAHGSGAYHGSRAGGDSHGIDGRRGGGGWHRGGPAWWGVGLGLGLGWEAGYYGWTYNPYADFYYPYTTPTVIVESVPQAVTPAGQPPSQPTTSNWYFCESAKAYYPYVRQCPEPWKIVPAIPPQTSGLVH